MTATDPAQPVVGTRMVRQEDPALLTGEGRFIDDLVIPGALRMAVVRSPFAHARIAGIDTTAAEALPAWCTCSPAPTCSTHWVAPLPCAWPVTEDMKNPPHYPLAVEEVHHVGDGVAVVVARTEAQARTPSTPSTWTTSRSRRSPTSRTRSPTGCSCTPTSAPTRATAGSCTSTTTPSTARSPMRSTP